jgi:methionine aminopeptidase
MVGGEHVQSGPRCGAEAARGGLERAVTRRGVSSALKGYDPPGLLTCPAVLRVSASDEIVHGIPGSQTLVEVDVVSLDCGAEFGGCLAVHGEHGILLTDHEPGTVIPVRGSDGSVGEIEE